MLLYAFALLPLALACGPGTGPISATPTLTFNYSSPLAWTWNAAPAGGQSLSQQDAQNRINTDIQLAVITAVESYGASSAGVSVMNAVQPDDVKLTTSASTCDANTYAAVGGAVTEKCDATQAGIQFATLYSHVGSITVNSPIALAQSNWEDIATNVWDSLTVNAGVQFYGLITVQP